MRRADAPSLLEELEAARAAADARRARTAENNARYNARRMHIRVRRALPGKPWREAPPAPAPATAPTKGGAR